MKQARMPHVYKLARGGYQALEAMEKFLHDSTVSDSILELVRLRVSQVNGCAVCVDMHARRASKWGESNDRIWALAAWRDTPYFTDQERAALALAEAVTQITGALEGVPDHVWEEAARHFDETALAALVMAIASVNAWNRVNVATGQIAGSFG
ncbi:carboxymuconolactone decarboxylase family protein [Streptomyces coeruleorubidus]|uniref:carboxymuconolactone decarboxylase family protein n=1 Tax=Streptomyces coeruleorubidus TaxID=116188 RepID=UPI0033BEBC26